MNLCLKSKYEKLFFLRIFYFFFSRPKIITNSVSIPKSSNEATANSNKDSIPNGSDRLSPIHRKSPATPDNTPLPKPNGQFNNKENKNPNLTNGHLDHSNYETDPEKIKNRNMNGTTTQSNGLFSDDDSRPSTAQDSVANSAKSDISDETSKKSTPQTSPNITKNKLDEPKRLRPATPPELYDTSPLEANDARKILRIQRNKMLNISDFTDPKHKQDPISKHIQLTAAIILTNLASSNSKSCKMIQRYRELLARIAFSSMDCGRQVARCLFEIDNSSADVSQSSQDSGDASQEESENMDDEIELDANDVEALQT